MNKLLKVTLITAIMATSGMCGGDENPCPQPTPIMSYDAYTAYLAKQKTCLDSCCTNCAKDLLGLTQNTPARFCCLETTLGIVGVAAGVAVPFLGRCDFLPIAISAVSTALALRSLVPSVKSCYDCGIAAHPNSQYGYVPSFAYHKHKNCECNDTGEN